jgi:hypothetical protein
MSDYYVTLVKIIITVPHAKCESTSSHYCDALAPKAAQVFSDSLVTILYKDMKYKLYEDKISLLLGPITRDEKKEKIPENKYCDLNRYRCRYHPWRLSIRKIINEFAEFVIDEPVYKQVWLFDIHSFPPRNKLYPLRGINSKDQVDDDAEVVFLDCSKPSNRFEPFTLYWVQLLIHNNINVRLLKGDQNDINDEAWELGAKRVFLIGFNEGLTNEGLKKIINIMTETFFALIN